MFVKSLPRRALQSAPVMWMGGGVKGVAKLTLLGGTAIMSGMHYGDKYGTGAGVAVGVASLHPMIAVGQMGYTTVSSALDYGTANYKRNRRLELHKPILDNYGTIQTMRRESQRRLSHDKTGLGRILGNEASRYRG